MALMVSASPNVFQRLIRQWDTLHPYNAAQVMRLVGQPALDQIDAAWRETISDLGVGPVQVAVKRHLDVNAPPEPTRAVAEVDSTTHSFETFISAELNRPFD